MHDSSSDLRRKGYRDSKHQWTHREDRKLQVKGDILRAAENEKIEINKSINQADNGASFD